MKIPGHFSAEINTLLWQKGALDLLLGPLCNVKDRNVCLGRAMRDAEQRKTGFVPPPARKKVVIVDDSRSLRGWLRMVLEQERRLEVVGEAGSAQEARQVIKQTDPDVITLDIEMPGMSGLDFLSKLMQLRPLPVVMLSGATQGNSEASITALSLGAIDCILKPTTLLADSAHRDIARRVYAAACSSVQALPPKVVTPPSHLAGNRSYAASVVLIGASTGGGHRLAYCPGRP